MINNAHDIVEHFETLNTYHLGNLTVLADPVSYIGSDRVLPIIPDEQSLICKFLELSGQERVIDAGTGSGVLALYASMQGCSVIGVDISPRAVAVAIENARRTGFPGLWINEPYSVKSATANSAELVVFNPPHHPTAPGVEVALHANGGEDGVSVCASFMQTSSRHIIPGGKVVLFQLSPSRGSVPKIFKNLREIFPQGYHARFMRILPTISNEMFLSDVYQGNHVAWIKRMSSQYAEIDLILAEVTDGGDNVIEEIACPFDLETDWEDRVKLHREILNSP